jgi:hypothetical protein
MRTFRRSFPLLLRPLARPLTLAFAVAVSMSACLSTDPASATDPGSITKVSGDSQSVVHGGGLAQPMVVRVLAANGAPLSGITVRWAVATGDSGTVADSVSVSNASGEASMRFTAGPFADTVRVGATLSAISVITFTHFVTAGAASQLRPFSGDGSAALVNAVVQMAVRVTDAAGNPISGVAIGWAAGAGGGTISTTSATTDANGVARVALTLGATAGTYTVTATSPGLPSATLTVTAI